jgi:hypothetical protein
MKRKPPPGSVRRARVSRINNRRTLTNKTGRVVMCETMLQRQVALKLERDRSVRDYVSFPEEFRYVDHAGSQVFHVPFVKIWRTSGTIEIRDVVPSTQDVDEAFRLRTEQIAMICTSRGWQYIVDTESSPTAHANLELLRVNAPGSYAQTEIMERVYCHLVEGRRMALFALREQIALETQTAPGSVFGVIAHMIWHELIDANLDDELIIEHGYVNPRSLVWREMENLR